MCTEPNGRDPFRVVVGFIDDRDVLVKAALAGGLTFDLGLTDAEAFSHKMMIRALQPRVLAAYDTLESEDRLATALAAVEALRRSDVDMDALGQQLRAAGWELRETGFVVRSPETREVFFPKGSPWDARVVLRSLFTEARQSITIVDAYCDETVFQLLQGHSTDALSLQVLCGQYAQAVAAEAGVFMKQFSNVNVRVRKTTDFHDRFVVLDGTDCVHVGASINLDYSRRSRISRRRGLLDASGDARTWRRARQEAWSGPSRRRTVASGGFGEGSVGTGGAAWN